jgi:hypothetical protein
MQKYPKSISIQKISNTDTVPFLEYPYFINKKRLNIKIMKLKRERERERERENVRKGKESFSFLYF